MASIETGIPSSGVVGKGGWLKHKTPLYPDLVDFDPCKGRTDRRTQESSGLGFPLPLSTCCRGHLGPSGTESQKELKMSCRGLSAQGHHKAHKAQNRVETELITILFKRITRMKLLFSNYLGDYSYSFQGSSNSISITVTISLFF